MGQIKALHQFLTGATQGDAITDQALVIRRWVREMGIESHIFAWHIHPSMQTEVRPLATYRPAPREKLAIYHHSIGSDVADFIRQSDLRILLINHNVTPPEYFAQVDPAWAERAALGQKQLKLLLPLTDLALADSAYNELDLQAAGYTETAVLPIFLNEVDYDLPDDPEVVAELSRTGPNLLFVGRLAPNKKQEDLVKLLFFYRRIRPTARLFLVGDRWTIQYDKWIEQLAQTYGLADGVILTGKTSQREMVTYYRYADLFVSMSEHEGFGKPLIESMLLDLPVLAYGVTAVPGTMGDAGVQFYRKDFERLAELVEILVTDDALRGRLLACQRERARMFLGPVVRRQFHHFLNRCLLAVE
ncbi:MAG: glycosyltransferase [Anaerolineae bacterium]